MTFASVVVDHGHRSGGVEVEVDGAVIRVHSGSDLRLVAAVVRALKAAT